MRDFLNTSAPTHFIFPIDGDCLNAHDGEAEEDGLFFDAALAARGGCRLTVNGKEAREENGIYRVRLLAKEGKNRFTAQNETDGTTATVTVFYLPHTVGKYRISSDDNILLFADITENKDVYTSIFDCPYLAVYKKAHDLYGAKVHLNVFYAFDRTGALFFSKERPDFDLSMMTDKFKEEWEANADWLHLSFHSRTEYPNAPYKHAAPAEIEADYEAVRREVLRFAGEKTFSSAVTTVHFGEATPACVAKLRELGHIALTGYFELDEGGEPFVAYYAPTDLTRHIEERDFWYDTEMGVAFGRIDAVTNCGPLTNIMADMEKTVRHPHRGGFVSFMIHEQYFYEDYVGHLPDFEARVLEPARLLHENGYTGSFLCEILDGRFV